MEDLADMFLLGTLMEQVQTEAQAILMQPVEEGLVEQPVEQPEQTEQPEPRPLPDQVAEAVVEILPEPEGQVVSEESPEAAEVEEVVERPPVEPEVTEAMAVYG